MTTTFSVLRKCSRCGKYSNFTKILRESAFASFDLDDRPSDYDRDALQYKVQECPHCGYAADDISFGTTAPDALFKSEEYLSCGGIPFLSEPAKKFYRLYLVKRAAGDEYCTFYAALHGAWASDDALDVASAVKCRRLALEQLEILESSAVNPEKWTLMKFDLLRRVRDFDAVVEAVSTFHSNRSLCANFAALELELAKRGEDACHTYKEIDGDYIGYYDEDEDDEDDEEEVVDDDEDLKDEDEDAEDSEDDHIDRILNGDFDAIIDADCVEEYDWNFDGDCDMDFDRELVGDLEWDCEGDGEEEDDEEDAGEDEDEWDDDEDEEE